MREESTTAMAGLRHLMDTFCLRLLAILSRDREEGSRSTGLLSRSRSPESIGSVPTGHGRVFQPLICVTGLPQCSHVPRVLPTEFDSRSQRPAGFESWEKRRENPGASLQRASSLMRTGPPLLYTGLLNGGRRETRWPSRWPLVNENVKGNARRRARAQAVVHNR